MRTSSRTARAAFAAVLLAVALAAGTAASAAPDDTVLATEQGSGGSLPPGLLDVFDTASATLAGHANVGPFPAYVLADPAGTFAYVNSNAGCVYSSTDTNHCARVSQSSLSPLATLNYTYVYHHPTGGGDVNTEEGAVDMALSPDGQTLYALMQDDRVAPISYATATPTVGTPFGIASASGDVVVTPDGRTLWLDSWVSGTHDGTLIGFDLTTGTTPTAGTQVDLGTQTDATQGPMAISPDGTRLFIAHQSTFSGSGFGPTTLQVVDLTGAGGPSLESTTIPLQGHTVGLVMSPDGKTLYSIDGGNFAGYSPIDGFEAVDISGDADDEQVVGTYAPPGVLLQSGAIAPDGKTLYVANDAAMDAGEGSKDVLAIALPTTPGGPLGTITQLPGNGNRLQGITVIAGQPATAAFSSPGGTAGEPVTFTSSSSPAAQIASYTWDFGDGTPPQTTASDSIDHTYAAQGSYTAKLTVTTDSGTSDQFVFNGHSALRNGSVLAHVSHSVSIAPGTGPPPAPVVALDPGALRFPAIHPGESSTLTETLNNTGNADLHVSAAGVTVTGPQAASFSVQTDGCSGQTIAAGASCTATLAFHAVVAGSYTAQLGVADDANGSPQTTTLTGTALTPALASTDVARMDFGSVSLGADSAPRTVTVTNVGQSPLVFTQATIQANLPVFAITADSCSGATVAPAGTCSVSVRFSPRSAATFSGALLLADNAFDTPQHISLSGSTPPGAITGHVYRGDSTPLAGAAIAACPQLHQFACTTVSTGGDGSYSLPSLQAIVWNLQVSPPGDLSGGSALVTVVEGQTVTQDFHLTAPSPLPSGMKVHTLGATTSTGVPSVNWEAPFNIDLPLSPVTSGPPGGVSLITVVSGISGAGAGTGDSGLDLADVTMFGVHFAADGTPNRISGAVTVQADCSDLVGGASPCAGPLSGSIPGGSSARVVRSVRVVGGPTAHAAGCPGSRSIDLSIRPGDLNVLPNSNGVTLVMDFGAASGQWTIPLSKANLNFAPPPVDPDFPVASAALAVPGKVVNLATGAATSAWNSFVEQMQALSAADRESDPAVADQLRNGAILNMATESLNSFVHGSANIEEQEAVSKIQNGALKALLGKLKALTGNGIDATLAAELDCPPRHSSMWIDPSGTVKTTAGAPVPHATVTLSRSDTAAGSLVTVPKGSTIMSPEHRINPDVTDASGAFGWDTLPGFYRITATHSGCRGTSGTAAQTPVLGVPPPRTNLLLKLRCPHLKRTSSRVTLKVVAKGTAGSLHTALLEVTVRPRKGKARQLLTGSVALTVDGKRWMAVAVDSRTHHGFVDLPAKRAAFKKVVGRYGGNGYYAASSTTLRP